MTDPPSEITGAIANAAEKFQSVEAKTYEIALALLLEGFTRRDIEAELFRHYDKVAAQVETSNTVYLAWCQVMRDVVTKALDHAEREAKKRRIQ